MYELNKATSSDTQGILTSNPYTVTHTSNGPETVTHASNGVLDETLFSCGTIRTFPALPPPVKLIVLEPQMLMTPAAKKIFVDATSSTAWTNWTLSRLRRMGINRTTIGNIFRACGISET